MLLPKDMEDRTLYTILAKPVARFEYLLGKLCGVAAMLTVATLLMTTFFSAVLGVWQGRELDRIAEQYPVAEAAQELLRFAAKLLLLAVDQTVATAATAVMLYLKHLVTLTH